LLPDHYGAVLGSTWSLLYSVRHLLNSVRQHVVTTVLGTSCIVLGSTWSLLYRVYSDSLDTPQIEAAQTANCDISQNLGEPEVPTAFLEL